MSTDSWPMDDEMGLALVRLWNEVVEDANPIYADEEFAASTRFGGIVAPPAMLMPLTTRAEWTPTGGARAGIKESLAGGLPDHPHAALLRMEQHYRRPMRMGERPTIHFREAPPGPETDTERGRGRIIERRFSFRDATGGEIAELVMVQLRYRDHMQPAQPAPAVWDAPASPVLGRYETRRPHDVQVGHLVAPITLDITLKRCIKWVAATRDFYEVHHDPAYAKASGDPDLFIGVHFAHAMIGRLGTDWGGPECELRTLDFRTLGRVYLHDALTVRGRVAAVYEADGEHRVDLEVESSTSLGVTHLATLTVALPG